MHQQDFFAVNRHQIVTDQESACRTRRGHGSWRTLAGCLLLLATSAFGQGPNQEQNRVVLDHFNYTGLRQNNYPDDLWTNNDGPGARVAATGNGYLTSYGSTGGQCGSYPCGHTVLYNMWPAYLPELWIKNTTADHKPNTAPGWNPLTNRMTWRVRCNVNVTGANLDMGTYIKSSNNDNWLAHYYHSHEVNFRAGKWVKFDINSTPHHRNTGEPGETNWPGDPEWNTSIKALSSNVHYFDGMGKFYLLDTNSGGFYSSVCEIDDLVLYYTPSEPDEYVKSTNITYSGSAYEVGWSAPKNMPVTYELRTSTSSMKASGWSSGTNRGTASTNGGSNWYPSFSFASTEQPVMYIGIRPKMNVATANSTIQITTGMGHSLKTGDQVNVENVCAAANGLRTVTVVDRTRFTIGTSGSCSYGGGGTVTATSNNSNFTEIYLRNGSAAPPTSPCDVSQDGKVDQADVDAARAAALGSAPCTADLDNNGRCDVVDLQRVINAHLGQSCRTN